MTQHLSIPDRPPGREEWRNPPSNFLKCNIDTSWINESQNSGVSWILRNRQGLCLAYSRRSYSAVFSSLENELLGLWWAIDSIVRMKYDAVIFESSSMEVREAFVHPGRFPEFQSLVQTILQRLASFSLWSLDYTSPARNLPATHIARSVTEGNRYQSYTARNGPLWLQPVLDHDAGLP